MIVRHPYRCGHGHGDTIASVSLHAGGDTEVIGDVPAGISFFALDDGKSSTELNAYDVDRLAELERRFEQLIDTKVDELQAELRRLAEAVAMTGDIAVLAVKLVGGRELMGRSNTGSITDTCRSGGACVSPSRETTAAGVRCRGPCAATVTTRSGCGPGWCSRWAANRSSPTSAGRPGRDHAGSGCRSARSSGSPRPTARRCLPPARAQAPPDGAVSVAGRRLPACAAGLHPSEVWGDDWWRLFD